MSVNTYNRHLGNESRPLVILKLTITRNQIIKYCNSVFSNTTFVASSVSSAAHRHPTLCDPMDCSVPRLPVHHQFLELTQIHVHQVSDAILASHPLLSPSSPTFNLSQYHGLFPKESFLCIRWPKYCSFSFSISPSNEHPGLISFRID